MGLEHCPRCGHPTKVYRDSPNYPHYEDCPLYVDREIEDDAAGSPTLSYPDDNTPQEGRTT